MIVSVDSFITFPYLRHVLITLKKHFSWLFPVVPNYVTTENRFKMFIRKNVQTPIHFYEFYLAFI